jgi:pentapeptide MXKDX repeat protein
MTTRSRIALTLSAAALTLGLAFAPAAHAQDAMKKDTMGKTDTMKKDSMGKDAMGKGDAMKKDSMGKDSMGHGDAMKKDTMGKTDAMKK